MEVKGDMIITFRFLNNSADLNKRTNPEINKLHKAKGSQEPDKMQR